MQGRQLRTPTNILRPSTRIEDTHFFATQISGCPQSGLHPTPSARPGGIPSRPESGSDFHMSDLCKHIEHRPYALPDRPWTMHMSWQDLLFAHWPIAPGMVRERVAATFGGLPAGLEIDTFEGSCYLGVVPFRMARTGLRFWPTRLGPHTFPELNVRTYVRFKDQPGVLFFSLDAASRLAVITARRWFYLPYFQARMTIENPAEFQVKYRSSRTHRGAPPAEFAATYEPLGSAFTAQPGTLEHWLTERYCLYSIGPQTSLWRGEIHHKPWSLRPAKAHILKNSMLECHRFNTPPTCPLLHYVKQIDAVAWAPERLA